ncbi:integrase [Prescottella agglutinans]|uniref:integrase n=1 Tax=Prescottella agglutinans TaxID=1644129 RepID=UPI003D995D13
MTEPLDSILGPVIADIAVTPQTVVLQNRVLLRDRDQAALSRFGDPTWSLDAAIADRHSASRAIRWSIYPPSLLNCTKLYTFALLNIVDNAPRLPFARGEFPSIITIFGDLTYLRFFLHWLDGRDVDSFSNVTGNDLDNYCSHVQGLSDRSAGWKRCALLAIQRLHAYREHLPNEAQLPPFRPFGSATAAQLANHQGPGVVNRTPRISAAVMEPMLSAALITVTTIAADISTNARRMLDIRCVAESVASDERRQAMRTSERWKASKDQLDRLIPAMLDHRLPVPAVRLNDELVPDPTGFGIAGRIESELLRKRAVRSVLENSGLVLQRDWLIARQFAEVHGHPWRTRPLDAAELCGVIRHVITACFLVIAYLSGVRTGEALNLRRGCITQDDALQLIFMSGEQLKTSPNRRQRSPATIPWVVTSQVADAVRVLESLTPGELLFPGGRFGSERWFATASNRARTPGQINDDLREFITWFNSDVAHKIAHPQVPADLDGPITAPRLRRTLAWHIVHRPGGVVAGATQYGHVRTQIMQGYAGLADAGFANEFDFEKLLLQAEQLHDDAERLSTGTHVSGPAADEYRHRIETRPTFAGITITSRAQLRQLEHNPALSIHHGSLLTCVYRPETAACRDRGDETGPDWARCKITCRNAAHTDRNIEAIRIAVHNLDEQAAEPLLPEPLRLRLHRRRQHLQDVVDSHLVPTNPKAN